MVKQAAYRLVWGAILALMFVILPMVNPFALALNTNSAELFRSNNQYFAAVDSSSLDIIGNVTVEAWLKPSSVPSANGEEYTIAAKWNNSTNNRSYYFRYFNDSGNIQLGALTSPDGSNFAVGGISHILPIGDWTHVAFVCSDTALTIYVNGSNIGTSSCSNSRFNSSSSLGIGGLINSGAIHHWDGQMDDVRVWNVARTQEQIAADMNQELVGNEPGLVGYWTFNGSSLEDATINNNDLTAVNSPTFSEDTPFTDAPAAPDPVIVIPGILGSAEHNGAWEMDPILHMYDDLLATLDVNGYTPDVDLFSFPYDWHASNVDTAALLKQKIDVVKGICNCSTIDLVVHSMGGLVARQYLQSASYEDDVDQVVFLGTPHLGAPTAYLMWEGGVTGFDLMDKLFSLALRHEAKEKGYANTVEYAHEEPVSSVEQLLPIYDYLFDEGNARPYPSNYPVNTFLEDLNATLDTLLTSGVSLYNFIGEGVGATTISGINVATSNAPPPLWEHGEPDAADRFVFGSGDGTVPSASASVITDNLTTLETTHRKLPQDAAGDVVEILRGEAATSVVNDIDIPNLKVLLIQIFSPADLLVVAPDGKKIGNEAVGSEINEIPLAFYTGGAAEAEFITILNPEDGVYTIITQGTGDGPYTVEAHYVSDTATSTAVYTGETTDGGATELQLNVNSEELAISGPDTDPPEIIIASPLPHDYPRSAQLPVSVTTEDASGVESLTTKLDGTSVPSDGVIDLFYQALGNHTFTAEATDTEGNATTSTLAFRVIATATSTIADLDRAYAEGWMTKKIHDDLAKKLKAMIVLKKTVRTIVEKKGTKKAEVVEQILDKAAAKVILKELEKHRGNGLSEEAYQLLREDILWLVNT